jgi:hypothetical protein
MLAGPDTTGLLRIGPGERRMQGCTKLHQLIVSTLPGGAQISLFWRLSGTLDLQGPQPVVWA